MRVGFTGTKLGMTKAQQASLSNELDRFRGGEFSHGDCIGADAEAHEIARRLGYPIFIYPPSDPSRRAFAADLGFNGAIMPAQPYMVRNRAIVDASDVVIAAPNTMQEVVRSGTWSTVRYARKRGREIVLVFPDGSRTSL